MRALARPVQIGLRDWVCAGVDITGGVTIGENTIVGAGAVVARCLPSGMIAAGVPARRSGTLPLMSATGFLTPHGPL
ncbi:hypothetical protein BFP70_04285 [Thioclava sp. SK-1]|uniref:hypothetical protein n=1 Tax=Thioclava sp. SK-1 TaxID=1889770 RepID=UPI0008256AD2|nr:hypothetical protein [Thioclava sp. SK-1]OCX66458.1 hypothetical protein BFP70_04285 [Thioclava sp. SK-1]